MEQNSNLRTLTLLTRGSTETNFSTSDSNYSSSSSSSNEVECIPIKAVQIPKPKGVSKLKCHKKSLIEDKLCDISIHWYWCPHKRELWLPAYVVGCEDGTMTVKTPSEKLLSYPMEVFRTFKKCQHKTLNHLNENLVEMCEFNDEAVLHQVRERYLRGEVYTNIGNLLISVNPYKNLYGMDEESIKFFKDQPLSGYGKPHIYNIASRALKNLVINKKNQSIIISGDSGSGKTESAKCIMVYFSKVAESKENLQKKVLASNPILEAFGNSKTNKNNNSSRFGKWMEISFSTKKKVVIEGACIVRYLLEKARVIRQVGKEQNFHIFYMICDYLDSETKSKLKLKERISYRYLNSKGDISGTKTKENKISNTSINTEKWKELINSFDAMGFNNLEVQGVFRVLSAILNLGNVDFGEKNNDSCKITNPLALKIASEILSLDEKVLESCLTTITRNVCGEKITSQIPMQKAIENRDSIAKHLYQKLFEWIVCKINKVLECDSIEKSYYNIGILDIFGFEVFETNRFNQFCINYANEKLQRHFTNYLFELEQSEYIEEGIEYKNIAFKNSETLLNMYESEPIGIISILDSESKMPKGSDENLLNNLNSEFKKVEFTDYYKNCTNNEFEITHYADSVSYNVNGFVENNKSKFCASLAICLASSTDCFISSLFEEENKSDWKIKRQNNLYRKKDSLVIEFKKQLSRLIQKIDSTEPHFVRCIKPNRYEKPNIFDSRLAMEQMRNGGLTVAIKVRSQGYAYRKKFRHFVSQYTTIMDKKDKKTLNNFKKSSERVSFLVEKLLKKIKAKKNVIQIGKSKVFYGIKTMKILEKLREKAISELAMTIQIFLKSKIPMLKNQKKIQALNYVREAIKTRSAADLKLSLKKSAYIGIPDGKIEVRKARFVLREIDLVIQIRNVVVQEDLHKAQALRKKISSIYEHQVFSHSKELKSELSYLEESIVKMQKFKEIAMLKDAKVAILTKKPVLVENSIKNVRNVEHFNPSIVLKRLYKIKKDIENNEKRRNEKCRRVSTSKESLVSVFAAKLGGLISKERMISSSKVKSSRKTQKERDFCLIVEKKTKERAVTKTEEIKVRDIDEKGKKKYLLQEKEISKNSKSQKSPPIKILLSGSILNSLTLEKSEENILNKKITKQSTKMEEIDAKEFQNELNSNENRPSDQIKQNHARTNPKKKSFIVPVRTIKEPKVKEEKLKTKNKTEFERPGVASTTEEFSEEKTKKKKVIQVVPQSKSQRKMSLRLFERDFRVCVKIPDFEERGTIPELTVEYNFDPKRIAFFLKSVKKSYPLSSFSTLHSKSELSVLGWKKLSKIQGIDILLNFQNEPISSSMLIIPEKETDLQAAFMSFSVDAFNDICIYQTTSAQDSEKAFRVAKHFVGIGIKFPTIRDELYAQLIKQTTRCPEELMVKGLKLLFFSLRSFPPSSEMFSTILSHLAGIINLKSIKGCQYNFSTSDNCAMSCYLLLENMSDFTFSTISDTEIQAITCNEFVRITVFMSDGKFFRFLVYPIHLGFLSVQDLKEGVLERVGLLDLQENHDVVSQRFQLCFIGNNNDYGNLVAACIDETKSISQILRSSKLKSINNPEKDTNILLRLKSLTRQDIMKSSMFVWDRVIFAQAKFQYIYGKNMLVNPSNYPKISAAQMLAESGVSESSEEAIRLRIKTGLTVPKNAYLVFSEKLFVKSLRNELLAIVKAMETVKNPVEKRYAAMRIFNQLFAEEVLRNEGN